MNTKMLVITALAAAFAVPAFAQSAPTAPAPSVSEAPVPAEASDAAQQPAAKPAKPVTEIVTRSPNGQAEMVKVNGEDYRVCKGEVQDGCINPRSAGLKFGARDLQYWPGRPASEIDAPLPAEVSSGG